MKDNAFVDTNIFIYLHSNDELNKKNIAISAVKQYVCFSSTQVLNEFCNVFIKKYHIPNEDIQTYINNIRKVCGISLITDQTINMALKLNSRYQYHYYDCLILASALEGNCDIILTEDMKDGQIIENRLKIVNPFMRVID